MEDAMTVEMALSVTGAGIQVGGPPRPHRDMLYQAVREALDEAGLTRQELDTAVTVSSDLAEGRSLSNQYSVDSIGGVMRPFDLRLANESLCGVAAGAFHLLSGHARTALVAGVLRGSDMADGEAGIGELLASRLNLFYERPIAERLNGRVRFALAELLQREGGHGPPQAAPPPSDLAVAVVLQRKDPPEGVLLRGIGWHSCPGWTLARYEKSVREAAAAAYRQAGGAPPLAWAEVPSYPPAVTSVSLRAMDVDPGRVTVNPSRQGEAESFNLTMDGLYWLAHSVRALRSRSSGTWVAVQSWQGLGTACTAVALLERR
jgi:hypothetical protein